MDTRSRPVVIAGGGIAGLTAALGFAQRGFTVEIYEQAPRLETVGAGIQLSPNATRILASLGVLERLLPTAVRPEAVVLKDAASLRERARVPLGAFAEQRWQAPYLTAHRADVQAALVAQVAETTGIRLITGAMLRDIGISPEGVVGTFEQDGTQVRPIGSLLIGADGVWSKVRELPGLAGKSRFTGELAWRVTVAADSTAGRTFASVGVAGCVTAFLHSGFHLIAYPVSAGTAINLVAFTKGERIADGWSGHADPAILAGALKGAAPVLARLVAEAGTWLAWPLHAVDQKPSWTLPQGVALIGDAAHAMTPFAAQGAGMAIEDAATLAACVAASPAGIAQAMINWEQQRKPRVAKVARRGALNHLAWHAAGPVALVRDFVLALRPPQRLASDLDWLYGWRIPDAGSTHQA
ncbi:MAG TPA: FAD-dependent monooxygenase [Mesorhizobium sp.]|uniref:FAD-dependent monooxygenase n=1 Tax=Mesorhizobium sp. TaxID=1871066 RepID=UPI002DDD3062|nr:FAD-dependent monooxygenase [Mesorhizobium sp.]HEV2504323.1 FAD-dependent monooxygenase [Mesorhizobium sp.]